MNLGSPPAFPNDTLGWVLGFVIVIAMSTLGWALRRLFARLDKSDDAMSTQSRALAILIEDTDKGSTEQLRMRERLHKVEGSTAYLKGILSLHLNQRLDEADQ